MSSLNHIHTYRRQRHSKDIYLCADALCSHSAHRVKLEGKLTKCFKCGNEFKLRYEDLRRAIPLCPDKCSMTKEDIFERKQREILASLFNS